MYKKIKLRNKIIQYLIIAFSITYIFWGLDIILSILGLYEHPAYNIGIVFYVIAVCAPAIAVYILMQSDSDKKGIRYFLKSSFKFNKPILEITLIAIFIAIRFGVPFLFGGVSVIGSLWQVIVFAPVMLLFGGFEEIGWRGYLQPKLEAKFGFVVATLINCAIWTVWHIPLCFIKGTYQYSGSYFWFVVSLMGSAFAYAALYKVKGSIIPCIIAHAVGNAIGSYGISIHEGIGMAFSTCIQISFATFIFILCNRKESDKLDHNLLKFECGGIDAQGKFLLEYTGYGRDISPEFVIENLSPSAQTIAITLEDLSHPIKNFTHWIVWNIPASNIIMKEIPSGKNIGAYKNAKQGLAYGWHRYAGPKPPKGKKHLYRFTLYALDCEMDLPANIFKKTFLKKAEGHILQKGEITGEFVVK